MRALLLLVLAAFAAWCQEAPPVFRAGATEVRVDVQVLDGGKPVVGLSSADFLVRDEGVPQTISSFQHDNAPVQLLLVLDVSGSMTKILNEMASRGRQALEVLTSADQVGVVLYSRRSKVALELTPDRNAAHRILQAAGEEKGLGAGTSTNEALLDAAEYWRGSGTFAGRRALLVITDNGSMNYQVPDEKVLHALSDANIVLNAIVPSKAKPPREITDTADRNPDFTPTDVFRLARMSGGEVLRSDKAGEKLREVLSRIRLRYSLSYRPPQSPVGTFRRIQVELSPEARARYPKAELRARAGYFALE